MAYPNGEIPLALLQRVDDDSEHLLPPGTAARWRWMVAAGQARYGVTLRITPGPNAYRWLQAQVDAKRDACAVGRCEDAADPGSSTHGGTYAGRECMAVDVYNWGDLADDEATAWARFVDLCHEAGFSVLLFDWEQWHITDFNDPWTVPVWAGPTPAPTPSEEDDMKLIRWNQTHVFLVGPEAVYHVPDPGTLSRLTPLYGPYKDVDNDGLTAVINATGLIWDAFDAVLRGAGAGSGGKYWSRLMAEGIAIRGTQAAAAKTLADVLATAKEIAGKG